MSLDIKAILLVAGEGKRLRPYTLDRPKCMVEVNGISLIDRQLSVLKSEGIDKITMVGGYKSQMLEKIGVNLRLNDRFSETNMVWSLFSVEDELEGDVIISYGDIVYSRKILKKLLDSDSDVAVAIDTQWENYWRERNENPLNDAETLRLREDGTISEIGKQPKSISEIEGQYMGLIKLSSKGVFQMKNAFHAAKKNGKILGKPIENSYMTDLLQEMINLGVSITSVPICDDWVEVDTVSDLLNNVTYNRLLKIQGQI